MDKNLELSQCNERRIYLKLYYCILQTRTITRPKENVLFAVGLPSEIFCQSLKYGCENVWELHNNSEHNHVYFIVLHQI